MGNFKKKHSERVKKVNDFIDKNKVFTVISVIIVIALGFNFLFSKVNTENSNVSDNTVSQTEIVDNESEEETITEISKPEWQFYWIDLWILVGAGGFCVVMIIRERKKAREELK